MKLPLRAGARFGNLNTSGQICGAVSFCAVGFRYRAVSPGM